MVTIVTLVKQSPDVEAVRIDPKSGAPDLGAAGLKVSDYDKNAVEASVQLKEKNPGTKVLAMSLGGPKLEESIKEVLAMGCDEAVLLRDAAFANADTAEKARLLAAAVKKLGNVDLVVAAEESLDSHSAQTGPRVAEELGWPLVAYVTDNLALSGKTLKATREVDEGLEDVEVELPAVITVLESLNTPRLPALMQILQAKNKPTKVLSAADLGAGDVKPVLARPGSVAPKSERKGIVLQGTPEEAAAELAKALAKEGVIG
ncbi:MAG TPA: electron transfer flavoprotein subunit beta/FixA family protein [Candidatus Thermoplasmatota archaeon]|nr:electron transfer flavoprotein subunit beta/FixA family protein [Candidatus Thermoplasmatota archaeon]